jgi:hypothetical protein
MLRRPLSNGTLTTISSLLRVRWRCMSTRN